jgi:Protein of unknown function (DUF1579)
MQFPEPQKEHRWLQRLVGKWTVESECSAGPDQPAMKTSGKETVRSLGGLWTIGEGEGEMPDGDTCQSIMTLGFDPQAKRFVGTFVMGVMTHLWPYRGSLDASERVLTLDSEGPSFTDDGTMTKYQDIIEFVDDDHRTLSSQYLNSDGQWIPFMKAHYRRVTS